MSNIFRILIVMSLLLFLAGCSSKPVEKDEGSQKQSSTEQKKDNDQQKMDDFLKKADDF